MSKYKTLVRILDRIREEAPPKFKKYYPLESDFEKVNQARARALIHLFLKVKFGLLSFIEREELVTDGPEDGGIDGYYISQEDKVIYFIQSKFRASEKNFVSREIKYEEILSMEIDRITEGEHSQENGKPFNGKVLDMIKKIQNIENIGRFKYVIVILANTKEISRKKLKKLTDGNPCELYNYNKVYKELVLPVVTGTYFNASELLIQINLSNKSAGAEISYSVETEFKNCDITVLFVPTIEIAKILHQYKNSILKFNPRSYLDMAGSPVNRAIADTIKNKSTNEFALFNNGITMLSDGTDLNKRIGRKDQAQLVVTNPQIINGGQTAYTLSLIYEEILKNGDPDKVFDGKEVLLKVITFEDPENNQENRKLNLIEEISKATNQQTAVSEADRRSNDKIQIELQHLFFEGFGYFYQRKAGEYGDGLRNKYIDRSLIIDREVLLRLCHACEGRPSHARKSSQRILFRKSNFDSLLNNPARYREYFFSFCCYNELSRIQKGLERNSNNKDGIVNFGHALRYGKYAVVSVAVRNFKNDWSNEELVERSKSVISSLLERWIEFEKHVVAEKHNQGYFQEYRDQKSGEIQRVINFTGYYKGRTINDDLLRFF